MGFILQLIFSQDLSHVPAVSLRTGTDNKSQL